MKSSREISQFHFNNFSTQRCSRCWLQVEFWVNIDPVNMCAVHTLPLPPFLSPPCSQNCELVKARYHLQSVASPLSPTRPLGDGYNCCEWVAHLFPETNEHPHTHPPGSSHALASVSHASLITTLVSMPSLETKGLDGCHSPSDLSFYISNGKSIKYHVYLILPSIWHTIHT